MLTNFFLAKVEGTSVPVNRRGVTIGARTTRGKLFILKDAPIDRAKAEKMLEDIKLAHQMGRFTLDEDFTELTEFKYVS